MSNLPTDDCFVFVVKTNSYAGNFERQMCSYITGEYGECEVGDKEAEIFKAECPNNYRFKDSVISFPDEHGCWRPATMWGHKCNDVAIFFETKPTETQLTLMRNRARKFAIMTNPSDGKHKHITIHGFELRKYCIKRIDTEITVWKKNE